MQFSEISNDAKIKIQDFIKKNPNGILIIWGATATGKTRLSVELSKEFPIEVISSDSRQIFKKMNIGTDKIPQKYLDLIPHHQINIVNPDEHYTAWQRQKATKQQIKDIQSRGNIPCIVGGTGLYIDTIYKNFTLPESKPNIPQRKLREAEEEKTPWILHQKLQKIDPIEAEKLHPNSTRYIIRALEIYKNTWKPKTEVCKEQPVDQPILMIGIRRDKETTNKLINARIKEMLNWTIQDGKKWGLIEEVQWLLDQWYDPNLQSMQGIGYKEVVGYLQGEYNKEKMEEILKRNTHHLAKKQRTRFRRYIAEWKANPKKNVEYLVYEIE